MFLSCPLRTIEHLKLGFMKEPKDEKKNYGHIWGMIAATIAWNQSNDCKECGGTWRKNDFTLCECNLNAPFSFEEIEKTFYEL